MLATYAGDQGVENSSSIWYDLLNPSKEEMSHAETSTGLKLPSRKEA